MVAAAEAADDREGMLQGRNWRVVDLMELGHRPALDAEIDAYEELADAVGLAHYRWYVPLWRAALALLEGRWNEAEALGDESLRAGGAGRRSDGAVARPRPAREHAREPQGRLAEVDRDWLVQQAAASAEPWAWLGYVIAHRRRLRPHATSARGPPSPS